ncbi:hypothetical protein KVR01_007112 [Diaporthe batatas]|uniref:uncharacterized protein n=1 Tax=Diaporthe batatas TaxID=748121 RepID=UPI001D042C35|nr:uncharacterized protein KVR01_007112 [Diaporthe batatas]KAG8162634.1 hypothetical protein KVR01_007112 [Diaporthe batatas]
MAESNPTTREVSTTHGNRTGDNELVIESYRVMCSRKNEESALQQQQIELLKQALAEKFLPLPAGLAALDRQLDELKSPREGEALAQADMNKGQGASPGAKSSQKLSDEPEENDSEPEEKTPEPEDAGDVTLITIRDEDTPVARILANKPITANMTPTPRRHPEPEDAGDVSLITIRDEDTPVARILANKPITENMTPTPRRTPLPSSCRSKKGLNLIEQAWKAREKAMDFNSGNVGNATPAPVRRHTQASGPSASPQQPSPRPHGDEAHESPAGEQSFFDMYEYPDPNADRFGPPPEGADELGADDSCMSYQLSSDGEDGADASAHNSPNKQAWDLPDYEDSEDEAPVPKRRKVADEAPASASASASPAAKGKAPARTPVSAANKGKAPASARASLSRKRSRDDIEADAAEQPHKRQRKRLSQDDTPAAATEDEAPAAPVESEAPVVASQSEAPTAAAAQGKASSTVASQSEAPAAAPVQGEDVDAAASQGEAPVVASQSEAPASAKGKAAAAPVTNSSGKRSRDGGDDSASTTPARASKRQKTSHALAEAPVAAESAAAGASEQPSLEDYQRLSGRVVQTRLQQLQGQEKLEERWAGLAPSPVPEPFTPEGSPAPGAGPFKEESPEPGVLFERESPEQDEPVVAGPAHQQAADNAPPRVPATRRLGLTDQGTITVTQLSKMSKYRTTANTRTAFNEKGPIANRPWVFAYTFGDQYALYVMHCPTKGCPRANYDNSPDAFTVHPLRNMSGTVRHLEECCGDAGGGDTDVLVRKYCKQVISDRRRPITIEWARKWNSDLVDLYGNFANFGQDNVF